MPFDEKDLKSPDQSSDSPDISKPGKDQSDHAPKSAAQQGSLNPGGQPHRQQQGQGAPFGGQQGNYQQGNYQQGNPSGGQQGNYQQGNYQQGNPSGGQQGNYQQGNPSGSQQGNYQQGNYQQGNPSGGQQGNYQQGNPSGGQQGNYQQGNYQQGNQHGGPQSPQGGPYYQPGFPPPGAMLPSLPNSRAVLILGILSLVFAILSPIIGLILGIIGAALTGRGEEAYRLSPAGYSPASYKELKNGKTCSIIGITLSVVVFIIVLASIGTLGYYW